MTEDVLNKILARAHEIQISCRIRLPYKEEKQEPILMAEPVEADFIVEADAAPQEEIGRLEPSEFDARIDQSTKAERLKKVEEELRASLNKAGWENLKRACSGATRFRSAMDLATDVVELKAAIGPLLAFYTWCVAEHQVDRAPDINKAMIDAARAAMNR